MKENKIPKALGSTYMTTGTPVLVTYSAPVLYYESSLTIASRIQLLVQEAFLLKVSNHLTGHVRR
jgi:hypothetical protein